MKRRGKGEWAVGRHRDNVIQQAITEHSLWFRQNELTSVCGLCYTHSFLSSFFQLIWCHIIVCWYRTSFGIKFIGNSIRSARAFISYQLWYICALFSAFFFPSTIRLIICRTDRQIDIVSVYNSFVTVSNSYCFAIQCSSVAKATELIEVFH